jgi:hypothetical protein
MYYRRAEQALQPFYHSGMAASTLLKRSIVGTSLLLIPKTTSPRRMPASASATLRFCY